MERENDPRKSHLWKREKIQKIQLLQAERAPHPPTNLIRFFEIFLYKKIIFLLKRAKPFSLLLSAPVFFTHLGVKVIDSTPPPPHTTFFFFWRVGWGGGVGGSKSKLVPLRARSCSWWHRSNFLDWKKISWVRGVSCAFKRANLLQIAKIKFAGLGNFLGSIPPSTDS